MRHLVARMRMICDFRELEGFLEKEQKLPYFFFSPLLFSSSLTRSGERNRMAG